jgi:anti-sigma-K factor RskA
MIHSDYKEMIPAHALSALDVADERALTEHLRDCEECRRELADWEATASSLALSADPIEPSPQVREKIFTGIKSDKSPSKVLSFPSPPRSHWGSLTSIAAIIIFAALIIAVIVLWQQNRTLRRQNEAIQLLLTVPASRFAQLSGTREATGANAKLAYDNNGRALLITNGLPRAPEGKAYQLWFIVGDKPLPGRTFNTDEHGHSMTTDQVPEAARNSAVFAVTLEPAGGVTSPTGAIYLRGEL